MQLSYPLQYDGNPRTTADQVAELEKAGLDMVWVAEAYGFDSPTLMGYLAAKTERLQIAAGIINVFSRTPGAILRALALRARRPPPASWTSTAGALPRTPK